MMTEELLSYFDGDELASIVWKSKYAADNEMTPSDMHVRLANEFSRIEQKYLTNERTVNKSNLSHYGQRRRELTFDIIYGLFEKFGLIVPQGSVMATLGTNTVASLSNCFVVPEPLDSYGSIMQTDQELVQLYKRRGGVGTGISNLRPAGTPTTNTAKSSTGAVSFMERFSNTTREVAMNGRRGALMLTIDVRHPDVEQFIDVKKDLTAVTGANISIKIRDEFIYAVQSNSDYILRWPVEHGVDDIDVNSLEYDVNYSCDWGVYRKVSAKKIWDKIIDAAWSMAEPGVIFIDRVLNYSPDGAYAEYRPKNPNPCVSGDTLILTDTGYYPISDKIGKDVNIWNGDQFSTVVPKITGRDRKTIKVELSDGRFISCTPNHTWYTWKGFTKSGKSIVKTTDELVIGDKIEKYKFPVCNYGIDVDATIAYTQGFYSGDGNADSKLIWLYDKKVQLSNFMCGELSTNETVSINGTIRRKFSIGFDVKPKEYVPVNDWSIKSRLDWLAGLIDSDGSATVEGGLQIAAVNREFLKRVQLLLSTLSIDSKIVSGSKEGYRNLPDGRGGYKNYFCNETKRLLVSAHAMNRLIDLGLTTHRVDFSKFNPNRDASRFATVISIDHNPDLEEYVYCFTEPLKHKGIFNGILTGNCGEQFLEPYNSCRLLFCNLYGLVKSPFESDSSIDFDVAYEVFYEMMRLGDDLVDLEIEYVDRIINKIKSDPEPDDVKRLELELWVKVQDRAIKSRRIGGGITALGDMLAAIGYKYDSVESLSLVGNLMRIKMQAELDCLIDLAILRGPFTDYDPDVEYPAGPANDFYKMLYEEFPNQVDRMRKYGRRSVSWSTIAPVGSGSILTQTTSGCEPLFMPYHIRRRKINPSDLNAKIDFIDQNGDKWQEYAVLHPKFKVWMKSKGQYKKNMDVDAIQKAFELSPYYGSTANDIDWTKRVQMQSVLQRYTTNAISSTLNLPSDVSTKVVDEIYMEAWRGRSKGCTIYRDGCRTGVLISEKSKDVFEQHDAPKRPKKLNCDIHVVSVKGVKYNVIVGLFDGKPYEVFCHLNNGTVTKGQGYIVKDGKAKYRYTSDRFDDVYVTSDMTDDQTAIARLLSTSLRHGANIKFLCEQLSKTGGELTSFTKAISRVLKTYIPDGASSTLVCDNCQGKNVIFEEGCSKCLDCGSSKCS